MDLRDVVMGVDRTSSESCPVEALVLLAVLNLGVLIPELINRMDLMEIDCEGGRG
jgi:hypothetical protein